MWRCGCVQSYWQEFPAQNAKAQGHCRRFSLDLSAQSDCFLHKIKLKLCRKYKNGAAP